MSACAVLGVMEHFPEDLRHQVEKETGVSLINLTSDLSEFDYLYRTERFGQLQKRHVAEQITLIEYLTLERLHERWQIFSQTNEQLRAELVGMVAFWIDVIELRKLTHLVHHTISPHWTFAYSLYVATRICGIKYLTIYTHLYLNYSVVHEGLRDRPVRFGPPGLLPKLETFLKEMAEETSHPPAVERFLIDGTRLKAVIRNVTSRIHRGLRARRRVGDYARTDMRERSIPALRYGSGVIWRAMKNQRSFRQLEKCYTKLCSLPELAPNEKGRSIIFFAHLQPEASTAPLAFFYHDARMAARELIDKGYSVFFKEHPQSFLPAIHHNMSLTPDYRSKEYYRDLVEMGCRLVDVSTSNDRLLETFDFAATCTGTVGLQAAAKGKWTITFGATWYAGMPGIEDARHGLSASPSELAARPTPTLPDIFKYFREAHGCGFPGRRTPEQEDEYFRCLARLALDQ